MLDNLEFSHFGVAVTDLEKSKSFFVAMGYKIKKSEFDSNQNIVATLITHEAQPDIEIISKSDPNDKTPIDGIIKNNSSAIYHVCYKCSNIEGFLQECSKNNIFIRQIVKPSYSILFDKDVSFYITDSIGLIEIIHE